MPAARVLVVGEALVDVTHAVDGAVSEHPGGSPLNVAVAAARLGARVTLAAQVGHDRHGEILRAHLRASGVELVDVGSGRTASATAYLQADGSATYDFDLHWDPRDLPDPSAYSLLHVGSIGSWMPPGAGAVRSLVDAAHAAGVPVGFDPNLRPTLTPSPAQLRAVVFGIAAHARVLKLSDEDAAGLLGPGQNPQEALDQLSGAGPALLAMTRGGASTVLRCGDVRVEVPAPDVQVADTIGAGDTWMGAVLVALLTRGWTDRDDLDARELAWLGAIAARAAAITCTRPGADPPWRRELPEIAVPG
ncbi:MAG: carbohydrate kinase [Actinomycetota bacterium]|nr:carbohydrate kinase [Actinomycetota bacterium]